MSSRPDPKNLIGNPAVPMSCQRIMKTSSTVEPLWIGPADALSLTPEEQDAYEVAHKIMCHLAIEAPTKHASGHPGGPLSSFTFAYFLSKIRNPHIDQPLLMSAGHLSLLAYGLQWLFGREGKDRRLESPQAIIDTFRTADGLPGHVEAGIGDIPFGSGPLGKGVSHGLGTAWGLKYLKKTGTVDVLLADGDCQEGQVQEAFRLASHLVLDNLTVHGDFNDIQLSDMPSRTVAADFARIAQATGWRVIEVQNGNDAAQVKAALECANAFLGKGHPIFICYYTTMGFGVSVMEEGSNAGTENYHGSPLKPDVAEAALKLLPPLADLIEKYEPYRREEKKRYTSGKPVATDILLEWKIPKGYERAITDKKGSARKDFGAVHIKNLMKHDERLVILHADLAASGGFDEVAKDFPHRVLNVGVAEANMYMMAAGLRQAGLLPVTYTFGAFGTNEARANARLIDINCSHTRCGVLHDCTHCGVSVGEDGETHQEQNYLNIPFYHTSVWMPADSNQAGAMAEAAFARIAEGKRSVYVFSPRSSHEQLKSTSGEVIYQKDYIFDGQADLIRGMGDFSDRATILAIGTSVQEAVAAADSLMKEQEPLQIRVLNVACVHPIDAAAIIQAALETHHLIVVEDHNTLGGLATTVADIIADFALPCSLRRLGLSHYFPSARDSDLKVMAGIDRDNIMNVVQDEVRVEVCGGEDAAVTAMHELIHNHQHSRFQRILPFVERLCGEKRYLEQLRKHFASRQCPKGKLPKNEELKEKLATILSTEGWPSG